MTFKKIYLPKTVDELQELLDEYKQKAMMFFGGTYVFVKIKEGVIKPEILIGTSEVKQLNYIKQENGYIRIGASVSLTDILKNDLIKSKLPLLYESIKVIGSPQIKNMGSLSGNIATASPAADSLPALYVYEAEVVCKDTKGDIKTIPISDFIYDVNKNVLSPIQFIKEVKIPINTYKYHYFEKVGKRNAMAISVASIGVLWNTDEKGTITEIKIACGSVAKTVIRTKKTEYYLKGKKLTEQTLKEAGKIIQTEISPISDIRATAQYRKSVIANLLLRLLTV